jgi:phospholipid:diacylglycerol acyltransferase
MSGKRAVIVCHSMGGNVWHYFMQWVSHNVHNNWVNDYIHAEILVSSPLLGLPKAYYSLLTGNNRDFTAIGTGLSGVVNHYFGFLTRRALWRTCSSLAMIMPIGGDAVWGEAVMNRPMAQLGNRSLSMEETYDLLAREGAVPEELQRIAPWLLEGIRASRPAASNSSSINDSPPEHMWANVLAVPLPFAPRMRKYAFYGVGVPTDFAGVLRKTGDEHESQQPRYVVHTEATRDGGFHLANGDYSCPVMTLGVSSGDHVDLLGNEELLADILLVASGGSVDERIVSNLTSDTERWNDS